MARKYYAQKDELGFPIPSTMMSVETPLYKIPSEDNIVEIPAETKVVLPGQTEIKHPGGLRYFVRKDQKGTIIPNSLLISYKKPEGLVYEFKLVTGEAAPTGNTVTISHDSMFDPICSATTTLLVQITSGTSLSDALTITGDFASLGAYYTPADPGNPMSQPPRFDIAYEVNGIKKNRYFTLTAVGVASGYDPMFGLSAERNCPQYFAGNLYRGDCVSPDTVGTPLQVTDGSTVQIGKYYKVGSDAWLITGTSGPDGMALNINGATVFNTCAEALA